MILKTPATPCAAPQEQGQQEAFNSTSNHVVPTKLHEKDISFTGHTCELTDDDFGEDESLFEGKKDGHNDNNNFYYLDFVSGEKILYQKKEKLVCDSSLGGHSPADNGTTKKRGCFVGTGADTTPLDVMLGHLESLLRKYIRAGGSVDGISTQKHQQRQTTSRGSNKNQHRNKILDIDGLITQCYVYLLSSSEEQDEDIYNNDENGDEDQGDAAQHARRCHLESMMRKTRIDIDRVISKCGLSAVAGDEDERLKRMTEDIPDIMRVSRENCNETLYDSSSSIRSLETFLP